MERSRYTRKRSGFTLTEMLLTTAIMTVLFGVAFVAGGQMIRSSRQAALDRMARSLYLAAERNVDMLRYVDPAVWSASARVITGPAARWTANRFTA